MRHLQLRVVTLRSMRSKQWSKAMWCPRCFGVYAKILLSRRLFDWYRCDRCGVFSHDRVAKHVRQ
jgi:hypothetical protein